MTANLLLKELSRYRLGTFASIVYRNALIYPRKDAFTYGTQRVTFAEFNSRANRLVHALQSLGVGRRDVVGVLSGNRVECFDVLGAAQKGGCILAPFNVRLSPREAAQVINHSGATVLFVGPDCSALTESLRSQLNGVKHFVSFARDDPSMTSYEALVSRQPDGEPGLDVREDDPLYIVYTAGTTGLPRGALWSHERVLETTRNVALAFGLGPTDRHVMVLPFFHVGGVGHPIDYFYVGAANVIMDGFDAAATLRTIQSERATGIILVPTQLIAMLNLPGFAGYDLSSLRRIVYVGSPMPLEVLKLALKKLGNILVQAYGLTEGGRSCTFLLKEDHVLPESGEPPRALMSCGRPDARIHLRIVDDSGADVPVGQIGEIILESGHNMVEYWREPELTAKKLAGGWLHTGDLGRYDEDGYVYIVDRKDDMIKSGGENVYPREIEEVLYRHPSVLEAAVIGVPDPYWVERVHAVVSLKEGVAATPDELIAFCKEGVARYKAPKSVEIVPALPKSPTGKILKRQIKERYWPARG